MQQIKQLRTTATKKNCVQQISNLAATTKKNILATTIENKYNNKINLILQQTKDTVATVNCILQMDGVGAVPTGEGIWGQLTGGGRIEIGGENETLYREEVASGGCWRRNHHRRRRQMMSVV